jgi:hypothetical protein
MYALRITFADEKNNAFVELGGAAWRTRKEQLAQWHQIPAAAHRSTSFLLDKIGRNGIDIEDTKSILAETVEVLLGAPITTLIDRGRCEAHKEEVEMLAALRSATA